MKDQDVDEAHGKNEEVIFERWGAACLLK